MINGYGMDVVEKIWIQWRKETLSHTHFDTIKLSKLQNKNKKKKNTRKAQTSSWNFVQRLYFLPPLEILWELNGNSLGIDQAFSLFCMRFQKEEKSYIALLGLKNGYKDEKKLIVFLNLFIFVTFKN